MGGGGVIVFLFNTVFVLNLVQYSFWIGFIFVHNLKKGLSLVISFFFLPLLTNSVVFC